MNFKSDLLLYISTYNGEKRGFYGPTVRCENAGVFFFFFFFLPQSCNKL